MRGATPPGTFKLSMRERLFHGVQALRMTSVDGRNPLGRDGLLTHSYLLGPNGEDCDLRRYGLRLKARGGAGATQRAAVAVARKLAVLLHRLWVSQSAYEPLRSAARHAVQAA